MWDSVTLLDNYIYRLPCFSFDTTDFKAQMRKWCKNNNVTFITWGSNTSNAPVAQARMALAFHSQSRMTNYTYIL